MKIASPHAIASSVGPKVQFSSVSNPLDNVLEMGLKKRHHSVLQFGKFFDVAFAAEDFVTDLRKASRRRKTHITCTND